MNPEIEAEWKRLFHDTITDLNTGEEPVPTYSSGRRNAWREGAEFASSLADKYYGMWQRSQIELEQLRKK